MIRFNLADEPDQQFSTTLNSQRVTIRLRYNSTSGRWAMDVAIDDQPVLNGQKVVSGVDMLYKYDLGIGAIFALPAKAGALPDRDNLPNGNVRLYSATQAEIDAAAS